MLQLIRTITEIPQQGAPHIHVAVISCDDEHPDHFDHSIRCMRKTVEDDSINDHTLAGGVVRAMRHHGLNAFEPDCGPGCKQSDPDIIWQKTYDGRDADGVRWIVHYSIIRGI